MQRLPAGVLALAVTFGLGGCASSPERPASSALVSSPSPASAAATADTEPPGSAVPSTGARDASPGGGPGTTVASPPVDQSTPEAAMTSWVRAMVAGDAASVCSLMAAKGKPIPSIPAAADACASTIASRLEQLSALSAAFDGLTIKGATVNGDTATFQSVTTEPAIAADVVSTFKAVKVDGRWYVTQG